MKAAKAMKATSVKSIPLLALALLLAVTKTSAFILPGAPEVNPNSEPHHHEHSNAIWTQDPVATLTYDGADVNIYSLPDNHHDHSHHTALYQFTPAALLNHADIQYYYSTLINQHFITLRFQLFNDAMRKSVAEHLSHVTGHPVSIYQVQPIPFDRVTLTGYHSTEDGNQERYQILADWLPYSQSVHFNLVCYERARCLSLSAEIKAHPERWIARFRLAFLTTDSERKEAESKQISPLSETIQSSSQLAVKVSARFSKSNEILMILDDAKRLVWNAVAAVIRRHLRDDIQQSATAVVLGRESRNAIYRQIEAVIIGAPSTVQLVDDFRWSNVYWEDAANRPDVVIKSLNERRRQLDTLEDYDEDWRSKAKKFTDETYEKNKQWIAFDGERFTIKPVQVVRVKLGAIRDRRIWQQMASLKVAYHPEVDFVRPVTKSVIHEKGLILPDGEGIGRSAAGLLKSQQSVMGRLVDGQALIVRIKNARSGEYLYPGRDDFAHDSNRRRIFTWRDRNDAIGEWAEWRLTGIWRAGLMRVRLTSQRFPGEYLYPSADEFTYDKERRRVFTWRQASNPEDVHLWADGSADWLLDTYRVDTQRHPNRYAIYNLKRKEYLYATSDDRALDDSRRRVFTWRGPDAEAWTGMKNQWDIEIVRVE